MLLLPPAFYAELITGRLEVIGVPGCDGRADDLIGQILLIQSTGNRENKINVTVTDVLHYNNLADYILGEGWWRIAPQTTDAVTCEHALMGIWYGNAREYAPNRVSSLQGINAIRISL